MESVDDKSIRERSDRLKEAVRLAGNAALVAKRIGMPPPTLNNYLGGRDMKASGMVALAEACGVSVEWLATGRGEMMATLSASSPRWVEDFGDSLQKPAAFYIFCLLMASCQEFFIHRKRRPTLGEALTFVAGPYRAGTAAGSISDSLIAETFKDPKKPHPDPWKDTDAAT